MSHSNNPVFHFPPATQKTVITTTTTTTLNFPPLLIPQNRPEISKQDSENCPLADAQLPTDWLERGLPLVFGNGSFAKFNPAVPSSPPAMNSNNLTSSSSSNHATRKRTTTSPRTPHTRSPPTQSRAKKTKLNHTHQFHGHSSDLQILFTPPDSEISNNQSQNQITPLASVHPLQSANAHLELATSLSLPNLTAEFSRLPAGLQQYTLFNLLKQSKLPVLQFVQQMISPALKRDFICDLPPEISILILSKLDGRTLCKASSVSKTWFKLINHNQSIWKIRLKLENLWIGDGSEEIDSEECKLVENGMAHWEVSRFARLWKAGTWNKSEYNNTDSRMRRRMSIERYESNVASSSRLPRPSSSSSSSDPTTDQDQRSGNQALITSSNDPYKLLYRRRFLTRQNWMKKEPRRINFQGHAAAVVTCIQFDWAKMVAASDDNLVHSYDLRTGRRLQSFEGHAGGVWALQYVGNTLVTGSTDRTVRVWDMKNGRNTHVFHGHTSTVRCLQIVEPVNINGKLGDQAIWEPEFPVIVTGSRDYTLRVWKLPSDLDEDYTRSPTPGSPEENGATHNALDVTSTTNPFHIHFLRGHSNAVRALAATGKTMVSGSYDCTVRAWDIVSGECTQVMRGHQQKIYSVVLDNTRGRCASGSMDNTVRLWDLKTGDTVRILRDHSSLVGLLGLSPGRLVSAAADATLRVWDPSTGACRYELKGHLGAITCFTHDEFRVVSGADGTLKLWNAENGSLVGDLLVGFSAVWQVSMDERFCVVAVQRGAESEYVVLDFGRSDGKLDSDEQSHNNNNNNPLLNLNHDHDQDLNNLEDNLSSNSVIDLTDVTSPTAQSPTPTPPIRPPMPHHLLINPRHVDHHFPMPNHLLPHIDDP
ncbi:hypothetical protein PSTG_06059 [Puccinia striiformis f. sp. tritici PST-78]|uniref:F-box domain-containing protein n=1 Tax=Puccinia striiformis f. sp. tritici PST-78 TaxID=1165861 RepID=A0A0L0VN64_9BASI|nr:hypothetical protein PSTG_06059 [Puccinia striiformis f. sp. tritici PST-78]